MWYWISQSGLLLLIHHSFLVFLKVRGHKKADLIQREKGLSLDLSTLGLIPHTLASLIIRLTSHTPFHSTSQESVRSHETFHPDPATESSLGLAILQPLRSLEGFLMPHRTMLRHLMVMAMGRMCSPSAFTIIT